MSDAYINEEFCDRVDRVVDGDLLRDDSWKFWERFDNDQLERMNLSELERRFGNFSKYDFAAAVLVATENYPFMVMQILAEYIERKGKKNNE